LYILFNSGVEHVFSNEAESDSHLIIITILELHKMNNETMKLLAQFTLRARKNTGAVDIKQMVDSQPYREEIFRVVNENADEELLMLSLELSNALSALSTVTDPVPIITTVDPIANKYMGGARG
jgi:hypothetical protein